MHKPQEQVREFRRKVIHAATGPARPEIRDAAERSRFIAEEAAETIAALVGGAEARKILAEVAALPLASRGLPGKSLRDVPDLVEVVDGLCDLVYVCYGAAEAIGVDLEPYFDMVHESNMAKRNAPRDGDPHGAIGQKPPGWRPPTEAIRTRLAADATAADHVAAQTRLFEAAREPAVRQEEPPSCETCGAPADSISWAGGEPEPRCAAHGSRV